MFVSFWKKNTQFIYFKIENEWGGEKEYGERKERKEKEFKIYKELSELI